MKRKWYFEKFLKDGTIETEEFASKKWGDVTKQEGYKLCDEFFKNNENIMAVYGWHVFMFSKTRGVSSRNHCIYSNRAGLKF